MGRIRTIKPEAPQSEALGRCSRDARLLFFMLFTVADDEGRGRAASRLLASLLFPYDEDAPMKIPEWLMELERENRILVYCVDSNTYFQIRNWAEHQKIDRPTKSKHPAPPERKKPRERATIPRETSRASDEGSSLDQGREGIKDISIAHSRSLTDFEKFWEAFPKKVSKGAAKRAYARAAKRAPSEQIYFGACAYARRRRGEDQQFTQHAATWLNADGWLDDAGGAVPLTPEQDAAARDKADRIFRRGKYAEPHATQEG